MSSETTIERPATPAPKEPIVHTPGPWVIEEAMDLNDKVLFHMINGPDGKHLSSTWGDPHLGNARLISAAPELLAALRRVLVVNDRRSRSAAKAAIAKASGLVV